MAEEIRDLIEKIQQEGVKVAQDKAKAIEEEAMGKAQVIIEQAKKEAERIIDQAKQEQAKMLEAGGVSLQQAGRDLLLSVKREINAMLDNLITLRIRQALEPEELAKIITTLIKGYGSKDKQGIEFLLNKEDLEKLEKGFLNAIKEQTQKGIVLKPSEDISGGFIISYDAGKSHFDFTDKALAEYIGSYLKPKLQSILIGESADKKT